ncbi:MAG: hypothetical protein Q7S84_04845 [bacterium]|nr:hypothetical protein [bacterium]
MLEKVGNINFGGHEFEPQEIGYEETGRESSFFVKTTSERREDLEQIERERRCIQEIYHDLPRIVPTMKIIEGVQNNTKVFAEYVEKVNFRGFITASTLYRSEDFCAFIKQPSVAGELRSFITATKAVLEGATKFDGLPEFTTYGNMGIDYDNHLRIIDYTLFDIFKKTDDGTLDPSTLESFGYEFLMFCLNYEYFFHLDSEGKGDHEAGTGVLNDSLYQKHLFGRYFADTPPEQVGRLLKELNEKCNGVYVNLPDIIV